MATALKIGSVRQIGEAPAPDVPSFAVRHFSPAEIAELWGLSVDSVRKIFENEPGVLVLGNPEPRRGKRSYTTLRVPVHVIERVHRRLSKV
ncbi:MAG TPA: hypothetical protein VOA41_11450 [Candidatus Dormibacteraeota bacterium]|nr:hypothetical protein [Candidatus Dormibacteraeota bacterium]